MHLKRLQLTGFKTFAERTVIEFAPGVTAIVGPNGSGKSNIADAVLWVLGEQKASAVRGHKATDVIFSGCATRKPLGLAEVSLTVDNSDGSLPLAFDEVTITRRAHRSGEGEYFINKTPCRLKDIYELFLDTGVGREAYALVNQSEIDAVLSADPEARRGLFEEAAGIKKYRVRKREALRKLEVTDLNLQRIRDIMGEMDTRIEPLRLQAEVASRYIKLRDNLREIECNQLVVDLRAANREWETAAKARAQEASTITSCAGRLSEIEVALADARASLAEVDRSRETARRMRDEAQVDLARSESDEKLAGERIAGLSARRTLLEEEIERLTARLSSAALESETAEADERDARLLLGERDKELNRLEAELRLVNEQARDIARREDQRRALAMRQARDLSAAQADLARAEARAAECEAAIPRLSEEAERLLSEHTAVTASQAAAQEALTAARAAQAEAGEMLSQAEASAAAEKDAGAETRRLADEASGEAMRIAARLHSLEELEASQEGYFGGVRAVKEAVRHNKLPPDYRVVADVLRVPEGLETAIEVALGSSAQDLVTSDEASAKRAIEYLKHTRSGRATFLPLSRMRSNRDPLVLGRAASLRGVLGAAIDLVKFPPGDTAAIETLLARTIVCEDLDAAVAAADIVRGWSRVVTCAGEVLSPNGAMTGGDNQKRGLGLIARKTRMAALETERREAQQHADSLRDQERAIAERQAAAGRQVGERRGAAQEARVATARAEETLRQAERDVKRLDQAIAEQGRRSDAAGSILERARTERTKVADRVASLARAAEGEDQFGSRNAEELARIGAERESLQARITQERVSLAGLSEKAQGQAKASRMARSEADRLKTQVSERRKQTEETRTEEGVLIRQAGARAQARADAATRMSAAQAKLAAVSATFNERSQTVATLTSGVHELQEGRATSLDAIRKMEQRETRWEMTRSQLSARLLEEYGATVSEVLGLEKDPAVAPDTPREVARLRRELRALGDVNVSACEEYEKLSERHRFLSAQRQDSEEARDRLLAAIREIDDSTRGVFMETFKAVGVAFQEIFGRLFRGGITELKLTDPENLLETGVEVMVQPPGKKKQSLMLLSGGERALTAAALLFAFLRVRPAPFCVLDEVDAPLDGVNVERFAQLMKEFGERTQFLCITHNPSTMEAAPVWYGVTMQEPGISHVLSLSIPAVGQASPAQDESPKKLVA